MSDLRVASRYAKSILDLAQERGELEQVYQDMQLFSQTVKSSRELELTLRNPIIKHEKKRTILRALFSGKVSQMTMSLFDIMSSKNREAILPEMATEYVRQYQQVKGINKVFVTTATPLTDDLRQRVIEMVTKETGGTALLEEKVDPSLLGGIVIKVGDRQLDESLRTTLRKLRNKFNENPYIAKI